MLIKNNQVHNKTKHLDIKLFFKRFVVDKHITLSYVESKAQIADILTKSLDKQTFTSLLSKFQFIEHKEQSNLVEFKSLNSIMKYSILLLLLIISIRNAFLIKSKHEITPHVLLIAYKDPCDLILNAPIMAELNYASFTV